MGILALEEYMLISAKYREEAYGEAGGKRCAEKGQERHLRLLDAACAYFLDAVRRTIPVRELSNGGMTRQLLAGNKLLGMTVPSPLKCKSAIRLIFPNAPVKKTIILCLPVPPHPQS